MYNDQFFDSELPYALYNLELYKTNITYNDFKSIFNTMNRYSKKFKEVSYLVVYSNVDSNCCIRKKLRNGQVGRPKVIVQGIGVAWHCHIVATGKNCYTYMEKVKKAVNKHFRGKVSKIVSKGTGKQAIYLIYYCKKQASRYRANGIFREFMKAYLPESILII